MLFIRIWTLFFGVNKSILLMDDLKVSSYKINIQVFSC